LALQDGELVAEQQDLDCLVIVAAPPQSKRGDHADSQDVDETSAHESSRSHRQSTAVTMI
jgi:hypothetical protein